jgi:peptidyl-prolyl cis-trans isomerase SurA
VTNQSSRSWLIRYASAGALLAAIAPSTAPAQAAPAAGGTDVVLDRIVATVGEDAITLQEARRRMAAGRNPVVEALAGARGDKAEGLQAAVDDLIAERLILAEAKKLDLEVTDKDVQQFIQGIANQNGWDQTEMEAQLRTVGFASLKAYEAFVRKDLLRSQLLRMKVGARVRVTDREVEEEFDRETEGGKNEEEVHLAHIVFRVPDALTEADVKAMIAKAEKVRALAASGDFAAVAKEHGEDGSADKGGDVGWFTRGKLQPSIEEVAFGLKDGEVSHVVLSPVGFHILKVLERRRAPLKDPDEVKGRVRFELSEAAFRKLYKEYIKELRQAAHVEVRGL